MIGHAAAGLARSAARSAPDLGRSCGTSLDRERVDDLAPGRQPALVGRIRGPAASRPPPTTCDAPAALPPRSAAMPGSTGISRSWCQCATGPTAIPRCAVAPRPASGSPSKSTWSHSSAHGFLGPHARGQRQVHVVAKTRVVLGRGEQRARIGCGHRPVPTPSLPCGGLTKLATFRPTRSLPRRAGSPAPGRCACSPYPGHLVRASFSRHRRPARSAAPAQLDRPTWSPVGVAEDHDSPSAQHQTPARHAAYTSRSFGCR